MEVQAVRIVISAGGNFSGCPLLSISLRKTQDVPTTCMALAVALPWFPDPVPLHLGHEAGPWRNGAQTSIWPNRPSTGTCVFTSWTIQLVALAPSGIDVTARGTGACKQPCCCRGFLSRSDTAKTMLQVVEDTSPATRVSHSRFCGNCVIPEPNFYSCEVAPRY